MNTSTQIDFSVLQSQLNGELFSDNARKIMYATDASAYREMPYAVCYPKDKGRVFLRE